MTWSEPRNLRDNTVITARYWNSVLGSKGSVVYLQRKTNQRSNCTIFSAPFTQDIPVTSSGVSTTARITSFSVVRGNSYITNRRYFNRNTGAITLPDNMPVILIWSINILNNTSNYTVRTTLERQYKNQGSLVTQTVASNYFFRNSVASDIFTTTYASVSWFKKDRYFLTCNHNSADALTISGNVTIIINPSFV